MERHFWKSARASCEAHAAHSSLSLSLALSLSLPLSPSLPLSLSLSLSLSRPEYLKIFLHIWADFWPYNLRHIWVPKLPSPNICTVIDHLYYIFGHIFHAIQLFIFTLHSATQVILARGISWREARRRREARSVVQSKSTTGDV